MSARAMVWERLGGQWHCQGVMSTLDALGLASLIRDPVSDDDDAHDVTVFELEMSGVVSDLPASVFSSLHEKHRVQIRGCSVFVTRRLSPTVVQVYDNSIVDYYLVAAP